LCTPRAMKSASAISCSSCSYCDAISVKGTPYLVACLGTGRLVFGMITLAASSQTRIRASCEPLYAVMKKKYLTCDSEYRQRERRHWSSSAPTEFREWQHRSNQRALYAPDAAVCATAAAARSRLLWCWHRCWR